MATSLPPTVAQRLAELAAATTAERRLAPALLDGYLEALLAVAVSGRRLTAEEQRTSQRLGAAAVEASVPLPALVDLYLSASRRLWSQLRELVPLVRGRPLRSAELIGIGDAVWRAADAALAAVSAGYVDAQRHVVRSEEAFRREFIDDLLLGRSSIGSLVERAERFGLVLGGAHLVVVASCDVPVASGMAGAAWVEEELRSRTGSSGMLVEATDGHLVCVVSLPPDEDQATASGRLGNLVAGAAGPVVARITRGSEWRVGIGREHAGPRGVLRSYLEARDALDLARRLGWPGPVVRSRELLVYRVLLRDEPAIADLVTTVLGPLVTVRGGPEPWLRTLEEYFRSGGNTAATARRLHLSVRAVSYRLARLADVTGYRAGDPNHQLPLLVAVTGARLLGWPGRVLSPE
jgi:sugar diacid utilization regulator